MELNGEQSQAHHIIMDFIENGDVRNSYLCVDGKAGTGKTTVAGVVVEDVPEMSVAVAAVAHKAKKEIASKISTPNVSGFSIAGLLGMKLNMETGEFSDDFLYNGKVPPIENYDLLIIDEASMIPQEIVDKLMTKKVPNTPLIFLGDRGQIRPITKKSKIDNFSPVFNTKYKARLTQRVRQGEGHPILEASDEYWEKAQSSKVVLTNLQRPNRINEKGAIIYSNDMRQILDLNLPHFDKSVKDQNTNIIKVVTYKNDVRRTINNLVRERLFIDPAEFVIGDLMILNDNYRIPFVDGDLFGEDNTVSPYTDADNSEEFVITGIEEDEMWIEGERYDIFNLRGKGETGRTVFLPVLPAAEKVRHNIQKKMMYDDAQATQGPNRRKKFEAYGRCKDAVAYAEHGYAITAHKSQGSTYDHVIVNLTDMLKAPYVGQEIASLVYTGMTRARKQCFMMNRTFENTIPRPEELEEVGI